MTPIHYFTTIVAVITMAVMTATFITATIKMLAKVTLFIIGLDIKRSKMFSPIHVQIQVIQKRKAAMQEQTFKIAWRWYWKIIFY